MVVARSSRPRSLRRQHWADPLPLGIGERTPRQGIREDRAIMRRLAPHPRPGMAHGVAARGDRLVRPSPARPAKSELALRVGRAQREHQAARFRHGEWDHPGFDTPLLQVRASSASACVGSTTKRVCATKQSVMNRYHASQVRTS